jgi:hypothetical protein
MFESSRGELLPLVPLLHIVEEEEWQKKKAAASSRKNNLWTFKIYVSQ